MPSAAPPRITLRPLTDADLPLLHAWLTHPALAPWWGDAGFTMAEVEAGYRPATLLADGVTPYVALLDGVFADPAVTRVQADPSPQNPRAIRCLEKAGFRRAREIVTPDGPAVYLLRDRHPE